MPRTPDEQYWFERGRLDGMRGAALMNWDDAPIQWTGQDLITRQTAYNQGRDEGETDAEEYAAVSFELRETEGLAASYHTNDPTNARKRAAELRERIARLEAPRGGGPA